MEQINIQTGISGAVDSRIGGRQENQDHYTFCPTPLGPLVVVCDGMGGGPAGKTASTLAAQTIASCVSAALPSDNPAQVLDASIKSANQALNDAIVANRALTGMGTTCVCLLLCKGTAYIGHVGDSRCYQLRNHKIKFRTTDHSQVAELVKAGTLTEEQARISPYSNIITRAIGIGPMVEPEIDKVSYRAGDRFALMSDGIWGTVSEPILVAELSEASTAEATVSQMTERTDSRGIRKGGRHDNLTLAVVDIQAGGAPAALPWKGLAIGGALLCLAAAGGFMVGKSFFNKPEDAITATGKSSGEELALDNSKTSGEKFYTDPEENAADAEPSDEPEVKAEDEGKEERRGKDKKDKKDNKAKEAENKNLTKVADELMNGTAEPQNPGAAAPKTDPKPAVNPTNDNVAVDPKAESESAKAIRLNNVEITGALNEAKTILKKLYSYNKDKGKKGEISQKNIDNSTNPKWTAVKDAREDLVKNASKKIKLAVDKSKENVKRASESKDKGLIDKNKKIKSSVEQVYTYITKNAGIMLLPDKEKGFTTKAGQDDINKCISDIDNVIKAVE